METKPGIVVVNAKQIVTLCGPRNSRTGADLKAIGLLRNSAMVCRDGRIEWIGSNVEAIRRTQRDDHVIDASGCSVLPGFVDCHTHPVFGGDRLDEVGLRASGASYQEIAAAGGGIWSTVRKTRASSDEELVVAGKKHAEMFLENGTTTIEAKSGYGLDAPTELRLLRAIRKLGESMPLRVLPTYLGAHAVPPEFVGNRSAYMDSVLATVDDVVKDDLAKWCDIFVENGYFDAEDARRLAAKGVALGLPLRMHVDQFDDSGGAALASELKAVSADHLEYTGTEGIQALADAGVTPVLLPASVYCLGLDRYPQAREMVERGLPITVATDFNPGSSPTVSMPFIMSLCCTQMRLSPEEALSAATINAAHVLGISDQAGSLEVGKSADFTVWPCGDWRELIYHVGSLRPTHVFFLGVRAV